MDNVQQARKQKTVSSSDVQPPNACEIFAGAGNTRGTPIDARLPVHVQTDTAFRKKEAAGKGPLIKCQRPKLNAGTPIHPAQSFGEAGKQKASGGVNNESFESQKYLSALTLQCNANPKAVRRHCIPEEPWETP